MELRHLRYFVAVAEELHFGRAAVRLHISQPPLSQQIKALEEELGTILLNRINRRVSLTEVGVLFLSEARATLEQADRAVRVAKRAQSGELGEVRIGVFPSAPLLSEVSRTLLVYRTRYPEVRLVISEVESYQQIQALVEERQDVAIIRSIAKPSPPPHIASRELLKDPFVVAMRRDHPLANRPAPIAIADLEGEPFVFYGARMGTTLPRRVLELCNQAGFEPRISQLADANSSMVALIAAGLGIAVVPQALCRVAPNEIVTRPLDDPDASIAVWILQNTRRKSPHADAFLKLLWTEAAEAADGRRRSSAAAVRRSVGYRA